MSTSRLRTKIVPVHKISSSQIREMYQLFERYYVDISEDQFKLDLAEKTHVILFWDHFDIVGFTTILRKKMFGRKGGVFLFSGDTVMDSKYWGRKNLQTTFSRFLFMTRLRFPFTPNYWMLISKGFKTYLLVTHNFSYAFPNFRQETPPHMKDLMDQFYTFKFGKSYSVQTGLIEFESSHGAVKGDVAVPDQRSLCNPHVKHFLKLNPKFQEGVELACIARLGYRDLFEVFLKYFIKKPVAKVHSKETVSITTSVSETMKAAG